MSLYSVRGRSLGRPFVPITIDPRIVCVLYAYYVHTHTARAPHTLGHDTHYTFQLIDGGEFHENRVHDMSIDGHSSLFAIVFKKGAKSLYLATHLMMANNAEETTHNIYVTYSSPTWSKVSYLAYHAYGIVHACHIDTYLGSFTPPCAF